MSTPAATAAFAAWAVSAGLRRRLGLARPVTSPVDLLLLDEPSNHLSLSLVEELEEAIDEFSGALVVFSHDRALRSRFHGTSWSSPAAG